MVAAADQGLAYARAGAATISVLTEPKWFKGTLQVGGGCAPCSCYEEPWPHTRHKATHKTIRISRDRVKCHLTKRVALALKSR